MGLDLSPKLNNLLQVVAKSCRPELPVDDVLCGLWKSTAKVARQAARTPTATSAFDQIPEYTCDPSDGGKVSSLQNERGRETMRRMLIMNGEFDTLRADVQAGSVGAAVPSAIVRISPNTQTLQVEKLIKYSRTDGFELTYTPPRRNTPQTWTFRAVRICSFTTNLTGKPSIRKSVMTFTTLNTRVIRTEIPLSYVVAYQLTPR